MRITTKLTGFDPVTVDVPALDGSAEDHLELYGMSCIHGGFMQKAIIASRSVVKPLMQQGKPVEVIAARMQTWIPSFNGVVVMTPEQQANETVRLARSGALTDDVRRAMIDELTAMGDGG